MEPSWDLYNGKKETKEMGGKEIESDIPGNEI